MTCNIQSECNSHEKDLVESSLLVKTISVAAFVVERDQKRHMHPKSLKLQFFSQVIETNKEPSNKSM